jgi:hypothetical protein
VRCIPQRINGLETKGTINAEKKPKELWSRAKRMWRKNGKCRQNQQEKLESESVGKKNGSNQNHKSNSIIAFFQKE